VDDQEAWLATADGLSHAILGAQSKPDRVTAAK